mgnify:CR=1 FL=1
MHVHAQPMPGPVHIELEVGAAFDHIVEAAHCVAVKQAQIINPNAPAGLPSLTGVDGKAAVAAMGEPATAPILPLLFACAPLISEPSIRVAVCPPFRAADRRIRA